jgi:hypothetical protein
LLLIKIIIFNVYFNNSYILDMVDQDYIINSGPQGTFRASGSYQTKPEDVDKLFNKIREEKSKKITLYFHGGLVNEKTGIETARKLYASLKATGSFPVFLVWETGLMETIKTNIQKISETSLYDKILKALLKVLEKKLGIQALGERGLGNMMSDAELNKELSKDSPFEYIDIINKADAWEDDIIDEFPLDDSLLEAQFHPELKLILNTDPELQELIEETQLFAPEGSEESVGVEGRGVLSVSALLINLTKISARVVKRFLNKRDHGFYPTVVEEILRQFYLAELGAWVWNEMKLKSEYLWTDNKGFEDTDQYAGRYFLDRLITYVKETEDENGKPTVRVDLVGHSAGSIAICNLLKVTASVFPDFKFGNIVLMAPACRTDLFVSEVLSHPERYHELCCFTMCDENEKKDALVPYFYTRSLLYLISGVLEKKGKGYDEHILGMERYLSGIKPYEQEDSLSLIKKHFSENGKNKLILSKSIVAKEEGLRTTSLSHGGFDDDEATIESVCTILKG